MSQCHLCGSEAVITEQENSSRHIYNCPLCGVYVLSELAMRAAKRHRHEVMSYLCTRRLSKQQGTPLISFKNANLDKDYVQLTVDEIVATYPKSFSEQMEKALENLAHLSRYPGDEIQVKSMESAPIFYVRHDSLEALSFVISSMTKAGLVDVNYYGATYFPCGIIVTPEGWDRFAEMNRSKRLRMRMLFVPGCGEHESDARACSRLAAEKLNLEYTESTVSCGSGPIGYAHAAAIVGSNIIVCDMGSARPDAYYAAGYAQALGKTVVMLCHADDEKKLAVDPIQMSVLVWEDNRQLYLHLRNFLTVRLP